jgi:alkanesulfonate monooxygenase SsuD/methylene tetrahydromethanopterin reductase-like flavin-dependent oxidoreductase (luciferase family)
VQQTLEQAQDYYRGMRKQIADAGRDPEHVKILPGAFIVIGRTQAEAEDKYETLQDLVDPVLGLSLLTAQLGDIDLSGYPLDEPLPELPPTEGSTSKQQMIYQQAKREGLTLRELYKSVSAGRGHRRLIGTAETIADDLEEWFLNEAADGFNIMPDYLPDGLDDIVELLVPELQRRGLVRTEYDGRTLRDNLGLPRPDFAR